MPPDPRPLRERIAEQIGEACLQLVRERPPEDRRDILLHLMGWTTLTLIERETGETFSPDTVL